MTQRRIDADVALEIESRLIRGQTPAQVERGMLREPEFAGRMPTLRTIQRIGRDLTPEDASQAWRLTPDFPGWPLFWEAVTALWVIDASLRDGWLVPLTVREARWAGLIHHVAADLGPLTVRHLARLFVLAEDQKQPTAWLEAALAVGPWRGSDERAAYEALGYPPLRFAATSQQANR